MFVCFNADIVRQFEFIQRQWCLDGNTFGLGHDQDAVLGTAERFTVQGEPPRFLTGLPRFVTTRGGEYLFMPGLRALAAIAAGDLSR